MFADFFLLNLLIHHIFVRHF